MTSMTVSLSLEEMATALFLLIRNSAKKPKVTTEISAEYKLKLATIATSYYEILSKGYVALNGSNCILLGAIDCYICIPINDF